MAHATYLASYPGLLTPEFVACSTTPPTGDIPRFSEVPREDKDNQYSPGDQHRLPQSWYSPSGR